MSHLLVINFFPAFTPALSGGELRFGKLYGALSKFHDITMLTSTDFGARYEEIEHTKSLRECRFPKDELWRQSYSALDRLGVQGDLAGLAFSLAVSDPACALRNKARGLAAKVDAVIHEFPYSEPIFSDGCPVAEVYNSHNFEASLLSSIVTGVGFDSALLKLIRMEAALAERARLVYATSQDDAEKFRLYYGIPAEKLRVCPNGFDDEELLPIVEARACRPTAEASSSRPRLLFFGSGHHPNAEAAQYICEIAPELGDCDIVLAGGVCGSLQNQDLPGNVILAGKFDAAGKARLLTEASVFINPVILGSGTSLKALEALGAGLPMASTQEGVRGLGLSHNIHCEIAPRSQFVAAIRRLLEDRSYSERVAEAGLAIARTIFSWTSIAETLNKTLFLSNGTSLTPQPLVLAVNDYSVLEPGSGGISRVRSLLSHVGCDIVLASFGSMFEVKLISPEVLHVTVPKTSMHQAFENALNEGQPMSVNDVAASLFAGSNRVLGEVISNIARRVQAVIFEHPYMAPLLDIIHQANPHLPVIYSSHNVEATHKKAILRGHSIRKPLAKFITDLEHRLIAQANLVVCCTEADESYFKAFHNNTVVVPNGCVIPEFLEQTIPDGEQLNTAPRRVGFLGSGHGPNVEAAIFIINQLVPSFPDVSFEFVGSVCGSLPTALPKNVVCHGLVTEWTKTALLTSWDIALNPVESGGGSSLKLPDYLAHGTVTLSTPAGARGFAVAENDAGWVTDREQFKSTLKALLAQPGELVRQRIQARRYAEENLSWKAITNQYRQALSKVLLPSPQLQPRSKLLVVTYRYTEPSLGGAEEYLIEVIKRLRPRFDVIDLAAIDVDHLTNHHHFGCRMETPPGGAARRVGELFDRSLYFDAEELPESQMFARSRALEREWAKEEMALLAPFASYLAEANRLRLFSGFFWPENHGGIIRRWTSPKFSFLIPACACTFRMTGYAGCEKTLRVMLLDVAADGSTAQLALHSQVIPSHFSVDLILPAQFRDRPLILHCEVDEHNADGDHRPFGILLENASVLQDWAQGWSNDGQITELSACAADLNEQLDEELRVERFDEWIAVLHRTAEARPPEMEAEFAAVRGPHAPQLWAWLAENAGRYDCVLIQGIPFDVIPSAVETLTALPRRPRIVTLPHFHGDDRFYHWRRYFDSFEAADTTLLFSSSIAQELGGSRRFTVVPGGGVRLEEQSDTKAERRFREAHGVNKPYYLVLGRKAASKGYRQAINAHHKLRKAGAEVELVLIGPDEDGARVEGDGVRYLGRQPREIVRGALAGCLGLITMSRSESFGIVLCEAWLFGKPVIANRSCYSFRELVRQGENGLLVTTDEELAEAMRTLTADEKGRERMGTAGFQEVVEKYSWEKVAEACFESLCL